MRTARIIYTIIAALLLSVTFGADTKVFGQAKANGKIAFERIINGSTDIFVMNADGTGETNITETPFNESQAAFSPDGSRIVFVRAPQVAGETVDLYVMDADGHNLKRLTSDDAVERFPAWSPDGKLVAYARGGAQGGGEQVYTVSSDGFEVKNLTAGLPGDHTQPAWSPDGQRLAFASWGAGADGYDIWTLKADGSGAARLTDAAPAYSLAPSWSPDGRKVVFTRNYEILLVDVETRAETNLTNSDVPEDSPEWSPDGKRVVFARQFEGNLDIYSMKLDGTDQRRLTTDPQMDTQPAWQPSNTQVAFVSRRDGNSEIYLMCEDGTGLTRLTNDPAEDTQPALSPDGRRVAFVSNRDGGSLVYVMNADGTGVARVTSAPEDSTPQDTEPSWSPDGTQIVFSSRSRNSKHQLYVVGADGTGLKRISDGTADDLSPSWSPDGRKIVFYSIRVRFGTFDIFTMNADGTGVINLTNNDVDESDPVFSPDGTKIAYVNSCCTSAEVYTMNADGSAQTPLTNNRANDRDPSWSPDSTRVVYASKRHSNNPDAWDFDLYATAADGSLTTRLTSDALGNSQPSWSTGATAAPPSAHTIQLTVLEPGARPLAGVKLTLSGGAAATQTTDANGLATFSNLPAGGTYTIAASKDGYTFAPETRTFANLSADASGSFQALRARATVGGRVLLDGSTPLAGVTVSLSGGAAASAVTDAQGTYAFDVEAGGSYTVTPSGEGLVFTPAFRALDNVAGGVSDADFGARVMTLKIGGRVADADGKPVAGASVRMTGGKAETAQTDANGLYLFNVPYSSDVTLTPAHDRYIFNPVSARLPRVTADGTQDFTGAHVVFRLSGRVADGAQTGIGGVTVRLGGAREATVKTDASGRYEFAGLPKGGSYTVTPEHATLAFAPAVRQLDNLAGDQTADFGLAQPHVTIGGRVRDAAGKPLAGVAVRVGNKGGQPSPFYTNAEGFYSAQVLAGGTYTVTVEHPAYTFAPAGHEFGQVGGNQTADFTATPVLFRIGGRVSDAGGKALAGVQVALSGSASATAQTDAAGNYSFGVNAGGDYAVTPSLAHHTFAPASRSFASLSGEQTADFTGAPVTHGISGRVLDAKGSGLAGVTVTLSGGAQGSALTDSEGRYHFAALEAGRGYTLTPALDGYTFDPASQGVSNLGESLAVNFHAAAVIEPARVQFSAAALTTDEGARVVTIKVTRTGDAGTEGTVFYETQDSTANERGDYTTALGTLRFAAGETEKAFDVLLTDDSYAEGRESLTLRLSGATGGLGLGAASAATLVIEDNDAAAGPNPAADAEFFVRQHYHDFLNREPDAEGLRFWADQLAACGGDAGCLDHVRQNVSAAFFLSIEFQQTGYLVHRLQRASYGSLPRYRDLVRDTQEIGRGVVVGQGPWRERLESNKGAFVAAWAARAEFAAKYEAMSNAQFVDALWSNVGLTPAEGERDELVGGLESGALTRAEALRRVAESDGVTAAEFNRAFVLMEYFGYLRRNPDDRPDADMSGFSFWLDKFNQFGGNYHRAEMVKAFIISLEYQRRFGR